MKIHLSILIAFSLCMSFGQLTAQNFPKTSTPQTFSIGESFEFQSEVLGESRTINVYLPASYGQIPGKEYPVIYLLDGSADEDFIHISGLVQFATFPWINMIPESIVIGIANVDRKRDFTFPTRNEKDKKDFPTTGKSELFISFLEKELQPLIQHNYAVNDTQSLIGQSLGGLLATEILFKKPALFDHYFIISPSLWWDDQSLLEQQPAAFDQPKSIYIAVGEEGKIMKQDAKKLYKKLSALHREKNRLFFQFFPNQNHGDALHLAIYAGFEKVFAGK
ncbi:MAG: alpha/beta hydrolase [Bacteroidia bacterium]|nr:alpha/beta hydrolase [Bacteroidia bacterium]